MKEGGGLRGREKSVHMGPSQSASPDNAECLPALIVAKKKMFIRALGILI